MKQLLLLAVVCVITMVSCGKDFSGSDIEVTEKKNVSSVECYYWAGDKKVSLFLQPDNSFILFNGKDRYIAVNPQKMDYRAFKTAKLQCDAMFRNGLSRASDADDILWAVGTTRGFNMEQIDVLYHSNGYKNAKGVDVYATHMFYVKLKDAADYSVLESFCEKNDVEILGPFADLELWYRLACTGRSDCDAVSMSVRFYESGLFRYAEPDIMFELASCSKPVNSYPEYELSANVNLAAAPNDSLFTSQWYLHNPGGYDINYLAARNITQGDSNITVMVIDPIGFTYGHPDLPRYLDVYETEYLPIGASDGYHGTNCVGIIGAVTNNGRGIAGIAPNCRIIFKRVDMYPGVDKLLNLYNAMISAVGVADVLSCSFAMTPDVSDEGYAILHELFFKLHRQGRPHCGYDGEIGCVTVFAAGNIGQNSTLAKLSSISVAAMTKNGTKHTESLSGLIVAPGENICTTTTMMAAGAAPYNTTPVYDFNFSHTSAACPQVAAVAALILSLNPYLQEDQVAGILISSARKLSAPNTGAGLLDAGAALEKTLKRM